jgi:hypothetical protein
MSDIDITVTGKFSPDCKSVQIDHADTFLRLLLPHKDVPLEITLKKFHRQRTLAQNNYIWGVVIPTLRAWMKERTGSCPTKEGLYAYLRIAVVGQEVVIEEVNGIDIPVVSGKKFSQMTTVEFAEAIDKIILHYAEQGLEIPVPDSKTNNNVGDFTRYYSVKDE